MAHFDAVLPGRVHRVIYERMVEEPEARGAAPARLLRPAVRGSCLRFYENERAVRTASSEQVRQPIFRDGVDQWRNYEPWLGSAARRRSGRCSTAIPTSPDSFEIDRLHDHYELRAETLHVGDALHDTQPTRKLAAGSRAALACNRIRVRWRRPSASAHAGRGAGADAAGTASRSPAASKRSWSPRRSARKTCRRCRSASRCSDTEKLEQLHVTELRRLREVLPSVSYARRAGGYGPGFAHVYMRGVASGDNGNHSGSLPSVGMYLDEQPITTIDGALDIHIYDIAARRGAGRPAGHAVRRELGGRHDPHHHQQARSERLQAGYDVEVNTVDHGGIGYIGRRLRQHPARRQRGDPPGRLERARRRLHRQCRRHERRRRHRQWRAHISDVVGTDPAPTNARAQRRAG